MSTESNNCSSQQARDNPEPFSKSQQIKDNKRQIYAAETRTDLIPLNMRESLVGFFRKGDEEEKEK